MRRLPTAVLSFGLIPALLALPVVSSPAPDAEPVPPAVETLTLRGVDTAALDRLRGEAGIAATLSAAARSAAPGELEAMDASELEEVAVTPDPEVFTGPLDTDEFGLVGVTWTKHEAVDALGVSVLVRVREDGAWSDWKALTATDEGPDAGSEEMAATDGRIGTSPLLTTGADGVQVRVDTAEGAVPRDLSLQLVDPGTSPLDVVGGPAASADAAPSVVTRAQWGADESLATGTSRNTTLKAMVVHHTASTNSYSTSAGARSQLRSIYAYHTRSLGWADIGYNFVVDKWGTIYEGRRGSITELVRGAHAGGFNVDTMGVSALGNYDEASAPAAMVRSIARVVAWKLGPFGVDPLGKVQLTSQGGGTSRYPAGTTVSVNRVAPHREVGQTACPGRYLNGQMGTIRGYAADWAPDYTLGMSTPVVTPVTPEFGRGPLTVRASMSTAMPYTVTVTSMCGSAPLRSWSQTGSSISVSWDLKRGDGQWAAPGVYRVAIAAGDVRWSRDVEVLPRVSGPTGACPTSRIAGSSRWATSVAEGRAAYPSGDTVVIVSGEVSNLVDGLVAGPLAVAKKAPILAVARDGVHSVVAAEIRRRGATRAWIVGGTTAVPSAVESQLRELGVTSISRFAGANRFATAALVAQEVQAPSGAVVVASGHSMVDAVSAAGPAARLGRPVLLVSRDAVPAATREALRTLRATTAVVVGGEQVISHATRLDLRMSSSKRAAGDDRWETAASVATLFRPLMGTTNVTVASGADGNLVDALAGGALGRITLLSGRDGVPAPTSAWLRDNDPGRVHLLGGPAAVSSETMRAIHQAVVS